MTLVYSFHSLTNIRMNYILDVVWGADLPLKNCDFTLIITQIIMGQTIITKTLFKIFIHSHEPCLNLIFKNILPFVSQPIHLNLKNIFRFQFQVLI